MDEELAGKIDFIKDEFLDLTGEIVKLSITLHKLPKKHLEAVAPRYRAFLVAVREMSTLLAPEAKA